MQNAVHINIKKSCLRSKHTRWHKMAMASVKLARNFCIKLHFYFSSCGVYLSYRISYILADKNQLR